VYEGKTIAVVVPAYNEEKLIGILIVWSCYPTKKIREWVRRS
jgi:hypothetical protein